ncbi:MAG: recombinase family protein [Candidatus Paceibacterota bacterium]|nr:MAG: recombinase family protein [Candidatus Paceibacterota bacterium]
MKYFLYARKSTDVEDKQVLSIEAQLSELRIIARNQELEILEEFIEKRSAKSPGRPTFGDMMARIQKGEANGIICWKVDRLARNPVDGGQVQWLLQQGVIRHIQTHDRSHYPNDNVLMMSVELGMANEYIRQLSANTARGLRQKARQGIYPGLAPIGYINDPRTKTIRVHKKNAALVREMFEKYASGSATLDGLATFLENAGVISKGNRRVHISRISFILQNPFYYGHFRYAGEVYEGNHMSLISKALYDKANAVLRGRGRTLAVKTDPAPYCGLLRCGFCGMAITAEMKEKHQKNGNVHRYTYYRCTRKNKAVRCKEAPMRSELLDSQLSALLSEYTMSQEWVSPLSEMLNTEAANASKTAAEAVQELRDKCENISRQITRLTDLYVAEDIEREDYLSRRRSLMSERRTIEENIVRLERAPALWVEPVRNWITDASTLDKIAQAEDLLLKKSSLQKIFGLNLSIHAREARGNPIPPYAALRAAKTSAPKKQLSLILEPTVGIEPTTSPFAFTPVS